MCASVVLVLLRALVGGRWNNALNCGLWYWNYNNASADYSINVGARPLILRLALVGGNWYEHTRAGLWCVTLNNLASNVNSTIGARPLVLKIGIWCVCFVVYDRLLLSAVVMSTTLCVACGIGIVITRLLITVPASELDHLY